MTNYKIWIFFNGYNIDVPIYKCPFDKINHKAEIKLYITN